MVSMDVFINRSKKRYTTKVLFSQASMTVADFGYHVETFLIYLPFPYFDIEHEEVKGVLGNFQSLFIPISC
jgi:hypothetical protein